MSNGPGEDSIRPGPLLGPGRQARSGAVVSHLVVDAGVACACARWLKIHDGVQGRLTDGWPVSAGLGSITAVALAHVVDENTP